MAINSLQWHKMQFDSKTMVDSNSLAQALMTRPELSTVVVNAIGDKFYLQYLTQGSGRIAKGEVPNKFKYIGNSQYKYWLYGDLTHPVAITSDGTPTSNIGVNFTPFKITVSEPYFSEGDVVKFRSGAQARIQDSGQANASEHVYTCVIVGNDSTETIPTSDVATGSLVTFYYTAFEEGSEGGSSKRAFPMGFENQLTTSRWTYSMTGSAATDVMVLKMKTDSGKEHSMWMPYEEFIQSKLWMQQSEYLRWYGKYNRTAQGEVHLPGKNGRPVLIGAGVLEQLSGSNSRTYSLDSANEDLYRDFLIDIQIAAKEADNKKILCFTGSGGWNTFHKAMKESQQAAQIVDTHFVSKTNLGLKFGENFVTYKGLHGTEVTVVYNPLFDDRNKHPELHPDTGLPYESYRMVFLDFSDYDGESNIKMVTKGKDGMDRSMITWYTAGGVAPEYSGDSGVNKVLRSHGRDTFECYKLSETGICVSNPLTCGQMYIPVPA
jgi:hypothetical protein